MSKFWEGARRRAITVDAGDWTGGVGVIEREPEAPFAAALSPTTPEPSGIETPVVPEPEPVKAAAPRPIAEHATDVMSDVDIAAYREIADAVGYQAPDATIAELKAFLVKHDLPVFSLEASIAYMDDKVKADNATGYGWLWRPLRAQDARPDLNFGTPPDDRWEGKPSQRVAIPGSDYYASGWTQMIQVQVGGNGSSFGGQGWRSDNQMQTQMVPSAVNPSASPYDKLMPLHALKKVALIERAFGATVAFFVSDYATAPVSRPMPFVAGPDPFLMALVLHPENATGVGRFIIDIWDEPGFGIAQMVKA